MKLILIVENDPDTIEILEAIIDNMGLSPICIGEPIDADYVNKLNPSLILLDHWLDGVHGADYCRELKANPLTNHIPILMLSAISDIGKIADEAGADAYFSKPFDVQELQQKIMQMMK